MYTNTRSFNKSSGIKGKEKLCLNNKDSPFAQESIEEWGFYVK